MAESVDAPTVSHHGNSRASSSRRPDPEPLTCVVSPSSDDDGDAESFRVGTVISDLSYNTSYGSGWSINNENAALSYNQRLVAASIARAEQRQRRQTRPDPPRDPDAADDPNKTQ